MKTSTFHPSQHGSTHRSHRWRNYLPLLVLLAVTALTASARQHGSDSGPGGLPWMHDFMGFFLVIFAMLKLFNLPAFADGFQMYDLLAKPFRPYAFLYPFIELGLGLGYLSGWRPGVLYPATMIVMVFGSLGVIRSLIAGLDLQCACMGNILKVPLSTVSLTEDLGMAAMAGAMWLRLM